MRRSYLLITLLLGAALFGAEKTPVQSNGSGASDEDIQVLRKDLRSEKKQIIAANLTLTDAEAERFWPVYDRFTAELVKIKDKKVALIQEYLENFESLNDEQATDYLQRATALEEATMRLRAKYVPLFSKILPGRKAAYFFQLEWRIGLMIDLQLASGLPMIEP